MYARATAALSLACFVAAIGLSAPASGQGPQNNHQVLNDKLDILIAGQNGGRTAIDACGTIDEPGAYIVVQNLTAAGQCLLITVDFVDIDLAGHVLSGDGTADGITSLGVPLTGLTLRNGTLTGFADGIDLAFTTGTVVQGIHAVGNIGNGIHAGARSLITGNVARGNGTFDPPVNSTGAGIIGGNGCVIAGNIADENAVDGIVANGGCTVTGNVAESNGGPGLTGFGSGISFIGNTARSNEFGLRADCPAVVMGNIFVDNGTDLQLTNPGECVVDHNLPAAP